LAVRGDEIDLLNREVGHEAYALGSLCKEVAKFEIQRT
jgi:hypothetical protein